MPLIALLFIVVPLIELAVIVLAAQAIGTPQTLVLLLLVSIVGAWLVKVEGLGVWRRFMTTIARGQVPHKEIVDGVLILAAGAFMLTPGFVTDVVGLLFLAPPSRAVIRSAILARAKGGMLVSVSRGFMGGRFDASTTSDGGDGVWDTTGYEAGAGGTDAPGTSGPTPPSEGRDPDDPPGLRP
jgi:UPF0716 protein FxsA